VMEMADIVVVNKADLDPAAAQRAALQLGAGMAHRGGAHIISALTGAGIEALWALIETQARTQREDGSRDRRRQEQAVSWMWEAIRSGLMAGFANDARIREQLQQITAQVASGQQPPSAAARQLLATFLETGNR
jgi:LAO/AO transport system kinase